MQPTSPRRPPFYPRWVTPPTLAGWMGVSRQAVYNWVKGGMISAISTPGSNSSHGYLLIEPAEAKRFLESLKMPVPPELDEQARRAGGAQRLVLVLGGRRRELDLPADPAEILAACDSLVAEAG